MSGGFTGSAPTGVPKCEHGVEKLQTSMGWADTCVACALDGNVSGVTETPEQACQPWCRASPIDGEQCRRPDCFPRNKTDHGDRDGLCYCSPACRDARKSLRPPTPRQLRDSANGPWEET